MPTCLVSGSVRELDSTAGLSVTVYATINQPVVLGSSLYMPTQLSVQANSSGNFSMTLEQSLSVLFTVQFPILGTEVLRQFKYVGNIPATTTANFTSIIVIE
jgi:hypothetical protein